MNSMNIMNITNIMSVTMDKGRHEGSVDIRSDQGTNQALKPPHSENLPPQRQLSQLPSLLDSKHHEHRASGTVVGRRDAARAGDGPRTAHPEPHSSSAGAVRVSHCPYHKGCAWQCRRDATLLRPRSLLPPKKVHYLHTLRDRERRRRG